MFNHYLITTPASPSSVARVGFNELQTVGHGDYALFREPNGPDILKAVMETLEIEQTDDTPTWEELNRRQRAIILNAAAASCRDVMPKLDPALLNENLVQDQYALTWLQPSSQWPHVIKNILADQSRHDYIAIAFDTSSQRPVQYLENLWNTLRDIVDQLQIQRVRIIQADNAVRDDASYSHETLPAQLRLHGRGGTSYVPVFQTLQKDPPKALIYVCDLYGDHQRLSKPDWPVLWVTPETRSPIKPSFGTLLVLPLYTEVER